MRRKGDRKRNKERGTEEAMRKEGQKKDFFFLQMVLEQVNLIHETPAYGKIFKKGLNHCTLMSKR